MDRNAKRKKVARARRLGLVALVAGLLLAPWLLVPASLARQEAGATWAVRGGDGPLHSDGFLFMPVGVDASGWRGDGSVRVKFTLEREGNQRFAESLAGVKVELDGEEVQISPGSLSRNTDAIKVLFMVDCSGSMNMGVGGVNKLEAAKKSLRYFVDNLSEDEQATIYAFNLGRELYVPLTGNHDALKEGLDRIGAFGDTDLYGSIKAALDTAEQNGIGHVILLTDGKDDTWGSRVAESEGRLAEYKAGHEQEISRKIREYGIPVYTIAIGDPDPENRTDSGVDNATLKHIAEQSNGGLTRLINIPKISSDTGGDPAKVNAALTEELKDVLAEIKKHMKFSYAQSVRLPRLRDNSGHLRLTATVEKDGKPIPFVIDYNLSLDRGTGDPIFTVREFGRTQFINTNPRLRWDVLTQIYIVLLVPLAVLALLPLAINHIATARDVVRIRHAIQSVERGSPLRGQQCPNEMGAGARYAFKEGDVALICPRCNTAHHLSCWEYNQHRCMNRVCEYQFAVPGRLLEKHGVSPAARKRFV
jgi:Mg-chelatase subunit ChlD